MCVNNEGKKQDVKFKNFINVDRPNIIITLKIRFFQHVNPGTITTIINNV